MTKLKAGVIGAGGMGSTHARGWAQAAGFELAAIADVDFPKAEALASKYGAQAFDSVEALLAAGVEALSVCLPSNLHRGITEQALAAGCHVMCEKPMALSVTDCEAMIEAAKTAGRLLSVAQVVRFFPEFANAHSLVQSGGVGKPAVVRTRRGGGFPGWSCWFGDEAQSGGILFDLAVHDIDWLLWTFGPVERVYAKGLTGRGFEQLDHALITLRHTSGAISHTEVTWADPKGGGATFEIAGDAGLLSHDSRKEVSLSFRTETRTGSGRPLIPSDDPYDKQIAAFARAITEGVPLAVTADEGRSAVAVAAAARESLKTGRAIAL
nr:Gfo/Idh/MocA family oxidoreductase [Armatimonas sp.]